MDDPERDARRHASVSGGHRGRNLPAGVEQPPTVHRDDSTGHFEMRTLDPSSSEGDASVGYAEEDDMMSGSPAIDVEWLDQWELDSNGGYESDDEDMMLDETKDTSTAQGDPVSVGDYKSGVPPSSWGANTRGASPSTGSHACLSRDVRVFIPHPLMAERNSRTTESVELHPSGSPLFGTLPRTQTPWGSWGTRWMFIVTDSFPVEARVVLRGSREVSSVGASVADVRLRCPQIASTSAIACPQAG